jgi:inward rectifier potassium channel
MFAPRSTPSSFEPSPLAPRPTPEDQVRDRDLGFGSVVSQQSRTRLLNRDGSFNVARSGLGILESLAPYHHVLTLPWSRFLLLTVLLYFALNGLFAVAYVLCGPEALLGPGAEMLGGRFSRAFYFSVQTFATIGYGQIGPNGFLPNLLVTIEALVGLIYQALATGVIFARFSRPTASILYSDRAIVAPYRDGRALQFRIANRRRSQLLQLEAQVIFSWMAGDGAQRVRRYAVLPLERNRVTFFPLAWTIVHPIDEASPLHGASPDSLDADEAEVLVLLSGIDDTHGQTVHSRTSYLATEIVWNARFRPIYAAPTSTAPVVADIAKLGDIETIS